MARKAKSGPSGDPEILILASLAEGPKHGYAIMLDVNAFAGVELGPGTLYSAITRLVERSWIKPGAERGRQRPYRLTAAGMQHLAEQLKQMRRVSKIGLGRLQTA
ncbi:MAG TPA: PadR family transcriptional regulator [Bryobacteraceae bacterium]|nr:PadR family transcriptional regulator [Bryobacteraceae bacterium]